MQLWTTSTKGLGLTGSETGRGERSRNIPERFRQNLIAACNSRHPDPRCDEPWCPILGHSFPDIFNMRATHISPWAEGQVAMERDISVGKLRAWKGLSDIRENGLMLSMFAEQRLADGDIVLCA